MHGIPSLSCQRVEEDEDKDEEQEEDDKDNEEDDEDEKVVFAWNPFSLVSAC